MDIVDRFPLYPLVFCFLLYPVPALIVMKMIPRRLGTMAFALLNVASLAFMCCLSGARTVRLAMLVPYSRVAFLFFSLYIGFVLVNYAILRRCRLNRVPWTIAFLLPIVVLGYVKYAPDSLDPFGSILASTGLSHFVGFFVGISYLSFRLVLLAQEVRNEVVPTPNLWEYLSFALYAPTLSIGPISPYSKFISSFRNPNREATPIGRSMLRILVGAAKYIFLGSLLAQFTYTGLLRNGHPHARIDVLIAVLAYPVYLYCNFSGYCDMVVGVSGLLGIEVLENFDAPFMARNYQEFWARWHMTLSAWIRDLIFTPLSKSIMRRLGPHSATHAIGISIMAAFIVVGVWHGKGVNFLYFGILQGIGMVTVHYYSVWLKTTLSRDGLVAYRENLAIRQCMTAITFCYFAMTLIFFANSAEQIQGLLNNLR
jgi:D-alanyl-lipoteichoic acid acyltransferase DltB (MBOAT superfamily)